MAGDEAVSFDENVLRTLRNEKFASIIIQVWKKKVLRKVKQSKYKSASISKNRIGISMKVIS